MSLNLGIFFIITFVSNLLNGLKYEQNVWGKKLFRSKCFGFII